MTTRVLHIFPKNDSMTANYVTMLTQALGDRIASTATDDLQEAKHIMKEQKPDILHQHGLIAWASQLELKTTRKIMTPHGQLTDGQGVYVVIARSDIEARQIENNPRIEIVRNPLVTKTVRPEDTAERMMRIYQKVMNSDVLTFLSDNSRQAMHLLMKVALCGDRQWIEGKELPAEPQWQLLYNYTWHEGVSALLDRGLSLMGLQIPPHKTPVSYLPEVYERPASRPTASMVELLKEVERQMRQGRLELMLLCDLHQALRHPSLDEEKLLKELEAEKLITLFPSVLELLKEELLLDEGYMPCAPVNNRTTAQLRTSLTNHLKI